MTLGLVLFIPICVGSVLAAATHLRLMRYVRYRYPQLWLTFGFRGSGMWVAAQNESASLVAQRRFAQFLRSDSRSRLQDAKLDRLVTIAKAARAFAILLFCATVAVWLYTEMLRSV